MRCSVSGGNGSAGKRTTLHDLYEKEGQSPWYDNLCRPVTDLLPYIARGVRGVTSNPAVNSPPLSVCVVFGFAFTLLLSRLFICLYSFLHCVNLCRSSKKPYPLQMLTMISSGTPLLCYYLCWHSCLCVNLAEMFAVSLSETNLVFYLDFEWIRYQDTRGIRKGH